MIRVDNLSKTYRSDDGGEVIALDSVDFTINGGELVVVVGPSGSGKSTLLQTVGGLLPPSHGRVQIFDQDLYALSASRRARQRLTRIGFIFQTFNLVPYLSCVDNVALPAILKGEKRDSAKARAAELLQQRGLSQRTSHRPDQLSVGERQRVAVARALINQPELVLADEPTGNLDDDNADQVIADLRALPEQGCAVVLVTHDRRLTRIASRLIELHGGRVVEDKSAKEPQQLKEDSEHTQTDIPPRESAA